MVKKALITEMYQVNLYCDKCGKRMERDLSIILTSSPPKFSYKCECGFETTSTTVYPYQQVFFDEENSVEVKDETFKK